MESMTPPTTGVITTGTAEADLVARAAAGDGAAFETLMRRHNQLLFRIARSILGNDADAEEAVQDAYLRAWRALGSYRAQSRLSTWLGRLVTNEALGLLRAEARALMEAGIDRLPDSYRTVFVLRAVEEMSVEDVAAALDIPPATVRTRFFRARSLMRAHLGADMDASLTGAFAFDGARCDRIVASVLARARAERLWTQGEVPGLPG